MTKQEEKRLKGPLDGIKVVECAHWIVGPTAGATLGDLGADVIKVEERIGGDRMRGVTHVGNQKIERNWLFECYNRNKRSVTLDLTKQKGKEILYRFIQEADVFITNFTTGALRKLGLDFENLFAHNPRLIYAHASGWGTKGPLRAKHAYDTLMAARAGFIEEIKHVGEEPFIYRNAFADILTGMTLVPTILAGLLSRQQLGMGQKVEVSGLGSLIAVEIQSLSCLLATGEEPADMVRKKAGNPLWNFYQCSDGRWIALNMIQSERYWSNFCEAMGIKHLERDPRFRDSQSRRENGAELLVSVLDGIFSTKSLSEWLDHFEKWDLLCGPVQTLAEVITDPQVLANDYIIDFNHPVNGMVKMVGFPHSFSSTPPSVRRAAPEHGHHTEEVLLEMGYDWEAIIQLKDDDVI